MTAFSLRVVNGDLIFNGPGFVSMWGRDNIMSGEPRGGYIRFLKSGVEWHFALPLQRLGRSWLRPQPIFLKTGHGRKWTAGMALLLRPKGNTDNA